MGTSDRPPLAGADALDGPEAGAWVRRACEQLGVRLRAHELHRIHHRPGSSLARVDRVVLEGRPGPELLVTHLAAAPFPDGVTTLPIGGATAAVWLFPHDPYLPSLPSMAEVRQLRPLAQVPHDRELLVRRRVYRPTRRAVLEVATTAPDGRPHPVLFVKVLHPARARRTARIHDMLGDVLPVPRVVPSPHPGVLALQPLPGRSLRRCLLVGEPVPEAADLVRLSLALRAVASPDDLGTDPRAFADPSPHVRSLVRELPDLAGRVRSLVAAVAAAPRTPDVTVHGDLHGGQVLVEDGRVTGLLDLDGVGRGSLADDAGNLVAHVVASSDRDPDRRSATESYAAQLRAAYAEVVGHDALACATAGAWLALAASAHRRRAETLVRARIERAAACLG